MVDEAAPSYDVTIEGQIGPAERAALRDLCAVRTSRSAIFRLRCQADLTDLTHLLEERGLSVISIRRLTEPDDARTA
jgi:hypothetical protein